MRNQNKITIVNEVVLRSIPINRKVKKYWITKYQRIAQNNGIAEAQRKMKNLRVSLMHYLEAQDRKSILDECLKSSGFRRNGYLRALFTQAECQPHFVLNFLKLYTFDVDSQQMLDEAAEATKTRLDSVGSNSTVPEFLETWFSILGMSRADKRRYYYQARKVRDHAVVYASRYCKSHTLDEWMTYWQRWYTLLKKGWCSPLERESKKFVFPEVYKDYCLASQSSESYLADFGDLVSMNMNEYNAPLNRKQLEYVNSFLSPEMQDEMSCILWGEEPSIDGLFTYCDCFSGNYVGHVHHIKKKGGGIELRDIAVPNRFIQLALQPGSERLYNVVNLLPNDATYNQNKFDTRIQNRVNNSNLYQGSVDLSKATDNLPYSWGSYIVDSLATIFGNLNDEESKSLDLFNSVAQANWEDEGFIIKWKVGQPLGSLPSFAMLSLTHNFFTESLSLLQGLGHSPYFILGDDIVIINKKLRKKYIREMTRRQIPLSLHKSYEGNLSEFAGKIYVKNCIPFYTSDHSPITWESLFDWQRSTGIRIPWNNLPRKIKTKISKLVACCVDNPQGESTLRKMASQAYYQAQNCYVFGRGSVQFTHSVNDNTSLFFEKLASSEKLMPEPMMHTGITLIGNGHPVVLMNTAFAEKDGYFQRFRPVELPQWYKDKCRPCATDLVIRAGLSCYLGYLV